MTYMILDSAGNAVASYDDEIAAHAALRSIADQEPDAADKVILVAFADDGRPVGRAVTVEDLPAATSAVDPTPVAAASLFVALSEAVIAGSANKYFSGAAGVAWRTKIDVIDPDEDLAAAHG